MKELVSYDPLSKTLFVKSRPYYGNMDHCNPYRHIISTHLVITDSDNDLNSYIFNH